MSEHTLVEFTIDLHLKTPVLSQSSSSMKFGMDTTMQRDESNKPAFLGSLIKGNIREILTYLHDEKLLSFNPSDFFGTEQENSAPKRGKLHFSQYFSDKSYRTTSKNSPAYRIKIDKDTRTVERGSLQVIESPYPVNQTVCFTGTITGFLTAGEANNIEQALNKALQLIPAIGANKGIGFGTLLNFKITKNKPDPTTTSFTPQENTATIGIRLKMLEAFCFATPALGKENHFETKSYVPGSAIIASIMNKVKLAENQYPTIKKHIDNITFNNAQPVAKSSTTLPITPPLSLVSMNSLQEDEKITFLDLATGQPANQFLTYHVDWKKEWGTVNPALGITAPDKTLHIRTAIDSTNGIASESQLFSMELVRPHDSNNNPIEWIANISLEEVPEAERIKLIKELQQLVSTPHLDFGKTKAKAILQIENAYDHAIPIADYADKVVVYLQSPARLLPTGFTCAATGSAKQLKTAYQKAWKGIDDSLELKDYYASQQLYGGAYWHQRFRGGKKYHPEILTTAGSVFVFDKKNEAKLTQLAKTGLPQIDDGAGGEDHNKNPWIKANGFGQILLNLKIGIPS